MTAVQAAAVREGAGIAERLAALTAGSARVNGDVAGPDAGEGRLAAATVAVPAVDPISLYASAAEAGYEVALWLRPSDATAFVGIGRAWAVEPEGKARFQVAEDAWRALVAGALLHRADDATGGGPILLGAMGFTGRRPDVDDVWGPFGPSSMVLPELLYAIDGERATVTASLAGSTPAGERELERRWDALATHARATAPNPAGMVARPVVAPLVVADEQPGHDAWRRLVGMFAGAVGRGRLDKVVLARRVGLRSPVELDVSNALRRLAASAPESTTFAFRRGGRTFLGATPERLAW
jgi:isochorismate synthase EntC